MHLRDETVSRDRNRDARKFTNRNYAPVTVLLSCKALSLFSSLIVTSSSFGDEDLDAAPTSAIPSGHLQGFTNTVACVLCMCYIHLMIV